MLWLRTSVVGSIPDSEMKVFFNNLVVIYWALNSIWAQFKYQCPEYSKSSL